MTYEPTYSPNAPLVLKLTRNGQCYRCLNEPQEHVGFPGNYTHQDGLWVFLGAIPHTCDKHEELLQIPHPDPAVWFQVSRRYHIVARLPPGMNGNEALLWGIGQYYEHCEPDPRGRRKHEQEWAARLDEKSAGDQFLRVYSGYKFASPYQRQLSAAQFDAFRRAGGRTYR